MPEVTPILLEPLLRDCTGHILETMFFAEVSEDPPILDSTDADFINSTISFSGPIDGELRLSICVDAAARLASDFCGAPSEVGSDLVEGAVLELTNMLCGAVLSRAEPTELFQLSPPRLTPTPLTPGVSTPGASTQCFALIDGGVLLASIRQGDGAGWNGQPNP